MQTAEPKRLVRKLYKALSRLVLAHPARAGHALPSVISSAGSTQATSQALVDLSLQAAALAARTPITGFRPELPDSVLYNRYPGEHYRLLKAMVTLLEPESVVEIGTFTGMGSFALAQAARGRLHTFDVVPWRNFESHLSDSDFSGGRVIQHLADLADPDQFKIHQPLLDASTFIFLDGPKDGSFEARLLAQLTRLSPCAGRILVIDDIRFVNMVDNWNAIASPKLDLTSFGHWSGTGLVDLSEPLRLY